jgi:Zn-dependent peptidase ImmA (M78 family)
VINTYSPWGELSSLPDLRLEWRELVGRLGEYVHAERCITLDPRMPRRQQRSVLCHELRHAERGDYLTICDRVNLRQEQRADREAARLLIDVRDLARALVIHDQHQSAAAVELRVSDAMLDVRLAHLHPVERHFLRREVGGP